MPPYKDKRDGRWRFRGEYRGKPYSGSTAKMHNTQAAAKALEKELLEKLQRRQFTGVIPTVREFAPQFHEYQATHVSQLTREGQTIHIDHVVVVHGAVKLDDVTVRHIDELKIAWTKIGTAPSTINTRLGTFRRMLSLAHEWKYIVEVPRFKWMPVDAEEDEIHFLTDLECAQLLAAAPPQWRSMILIGLRTGLRIGELRGLQWTDVNLTTRVIRVARTDPGRPDMDANSPKGGKSRTVPLTEEAFAAITAIERAGKWVWPALEYHGKRTRDRPRSTSGCYQGIVKAGIAAGLDNVNPHVLRHTYASQLAMRGVSLKSIQELLGHASIKQTEVYAHLSPGFAHHAAVAALDVPLLVLNGASTPELPPGTPVTKSRHRR